mmetsp:Transcript_5266/g.15272  ORF Transcript_5266/g.15272 Transcript_5266/m.15272 type:complete len:224 (-) Transcript_5266:2362-3033(-)
MHPPALNGEETARDNIEAPDRSKNAGKASIHTFAICCASSKFSTSMKYPRAEATVPRKAITMHETEVRNKGTNDSSPINCIMINQATPQPNSMLNNINRRRRSLSFPPELSLLSFSSKGPVNAKRVAREAAIRPQPPVFPLDTPSPKLETVAKTLLGVVKSLDPGRVGAANRIPNPSRNISADAFLHISAPPSGKKWFSMDKTASPQSDEPAPRSSNSVGGVL